MQVRRAIGLVGAVLVMGLVGACSSSSRTTGDEDDSGDTDGGGQDGARPDASGSDGGSPDSGGDEDADGPCDPQGCEELGFACGAADDGCGGPLDCGACTAEFDTCGGGGVANQCGCTPRTCEQLVLAGQTACGDIVEDGCGGTIEGGCGTCEAQVGEGWTCNQASSVCECAALTEAQACAGAGRVCGVASDGCGGPEYNCGTCSAARDCGGDGTCTCKPADGAYAATACGGSTCGTVTVDGCPFTCGAACGGGECAPTSPCSGAGSSCACPAAQPVCNSTTALCCSPATTPQQILALCTAQSLGCGATVTDPCGGATHTCGCAAGQGCVDKAYIEGATQNACLPANEAALLGAYVVRTHQFTRLLANAEKAETVSLASITKKANGAFQMVDKGCVATTSAAPSVAPAYPNVPSAVVPVTLSGNSWVRGEVLPTPPIGFEPSMPSFCAASPGGVPSVGADYDTETSDFDTTPTASSGSQKAWLTANNGTCTCPTTNAVCTRSTVSQACVPPQNLGSPSAATDCRINDPDRDGRPGYTVIPQLINAPVTAASVGPTKWAGAVNTSGFHSGRATEPSPLYRNFMSCGGNALVCGLLGGASTSQTCGANGDKFNRIHFSKVTPAVFASLSCRAFYNRAIDGPGGVASATSWSSGTNTVSTAVNASAINSYFDGSRGATCAAPNACPEGSICTSGRCWPMTTPGACTEDAQCNSNPANTNTPSWACRGTACAPASCPAP